MKMKWLELCRVDKTEGLWDVSPRAAEHSEQNNSLKYQNDKECHSWITITEKIHMITQKTNTQWQERWMRKYKTGKYETGTYQCLIVFLFLKLVQKKE